MGFEISEAMIRLSREYISKVKCCDECFCEYWCIKHETKKSRIPYTNCYINVISCLEDAFREYFEEVTV